MKINTFISIKIPYCVGKNSQIGQRTRTILYYWKTSLKNVRSPPQKDAPTGKDEIRKRRNVLKNKGYYFIMEIDEPIEFVKGDKVYIENKEYTILSVRIETYDNGNITRYIAVITPDTIEHAECRVIQNIVDGKVMLFIGSKPT